MSVAELRNSLIDLADVARAAKKPAKRGRRSPGDDPEKDEAIKLLMGFVVRFGRVEASKNDDSPFVVFATEAYQLATGEPANLIRSIRRMRKLGYPAISRARKDAKKTKT